jgi:hypothetical protein
MVLKYKKAHCLEGALFAATALMLQGHPPLIMNLKTIRGDQHHAVALFKQNGYWGTISKTNHAILRFRDPVYRTLRELALSYFHEYFLAESGTKSLRSYSKPLNLKRFGTTWITSTKDLWNIAYALEDAPIFPLVPPKNLKHLKRATTFEREAIAPPEWKKNNPET